MQLLFENSTEEKFSEGLSVIKGTVRPLSAEHNFKVPNIGWKKFHLIKKASC